MSSRWPIWVALGLQACASTGVGNPAPVKLQLGITRDDAELEAVGGEPNAAGSGSDQAGAPETDRGGAAGTDGDGGASASGGASSDTGVAGANDGGANAGSGPTVLPRAAIREAILVIGELRFLPCDASISVVRAAGPFLIDLAHGATSPAIPEVLVPEGGFCGLEAPLAPAVEPSRLVGRSVYFEGLRADGTPFRIDANVQATLRVRARSGVTWDPRVTQARSLFWALRPRRWLQPGELNALRATLLSDGSTTAIDIERHPALLRAVRSRLAGSSTLYADTNNDDIFDVRDRDAVVGDGLPDAN